MDQVQEDLAKALKSAVEHMRSMNAGQLKMVLRKKDNTPICGIFVVDGEENTSELLDASDAMDE